MPASKFRLNPAAEVELKDASDWYESRRPGLGLEFLAAVHSKVRDVVDNPHGWRALNGMRRAPVGRFPYSVVYRELTADEIEIVAVAHFKRRPRYWSGR